MEKALVQKLLDKISSKAFIQDEKLRTPCDLDLEIPIKYIVNGRIVERNNQKIVELEAKSEIGNHSIEIRHSGEIGIQKLEVK